MNPRTAQAIFLLGWAACLLSLACLIFGLFDLRYHRGVIAGIERFDAAHIQSHENTIKHVENEMTLGALTLVGSLACIGLGRYFMNIKGRSYERR